jgi:CO/xanthine dehydrogenase Mo-binding subunit
MPTDGPAPAIVNAIRHLRLDVREIPATPERIMKALTISDSGSRISR